MYHSGYGGEDMYVIVTYDVHKTRCNRVMKYLRQWLEHRQRSVFAGFLTESQVKIMYEGLLQLINVKYDAVIVFQSNRANQVSEWTTNAAEQMKTGGILAPQVNGAGVAPVEQRRNKKQQSAGNRKKKKKRLRFRPINK